MKTLSLVSVATISAALCGIALADQAKAPPPVGKPATAPSTTPPNSTGAPIPAPPPPSTELGTLMKPLEGTWKCKSTFPAGMMGEGTPEMTASSTVKFKKEAGGYFYRGTYTIAKQKGFPMAMSGEFFMVYDATAKQVISTGVSSMGEAMYSTGPIDSTGLSVTMTGTSTMNGKPVKYRETMASAGKTASHKMELDMGKGSFVTMGSDDCKR